jgi:hypothetical protein
MIGLGVDYFKVIFNNIFEETNQNGQIFMQNGKSTKWIWKP